MLLFELGVWNLQLSFIRDNFVSNNPFRCFYFLFPFIPSFSISILCFIFFFHISASVSKYFLSPFPFFSNSLSTYHPVVLLVSDWLFSCFIFTYFLPSGFLSFILWFPPSFFSWELYFHSFLFFTVFKAMNFPLSFALITSHLQWYIFTLLFWARC